MSEPSSSPSSPSIVGAPQPPASLSALANVELQLIMHGLSITERIAVASCSKRLIAVIDSPFAWKHAPPLALISHQTSRVLSVAGSRFRRHIPVALQWKPLLPSAKDVDALLRLPLQLRELDASSHDAVTPAVWRRILAHPSMQQLRVLRMHDLSKKRVVDVEMMRLIVALPHLHTLTLAAIVDFNHAPWSLLASAPSLTSLQTNDTHFVASSSRLPAIAQCAGVTELYVCEPALYDGAFGSFRMPQLQALTLDNLVVSKPETCAPLQPEEFISAFSALTQLRTLHLRRCYGVNAMLPHLFHLVALRTLVIEPDVSSFRYQDHYGTVPNAAVVEQLLLAAPHLQMTVSLSLAALYQPRSDQYVIASDSTAAVSISSLRTLEQALPAQLVIQILSSLREAVRRNHGV